MSTVADKLAKKSTRKTSGKQVRLRLVYVDFWSAVKLSFLGAVALAVVTMVSFFLIFLVFQATGIMTTAESFLLGITDNTFVLSEVVGLPQVMAFAAVVAILNLIVFTVLGAVVAGIYNLAVKVTGGLLVGFMSN
ncbi:DUF3566 domain-containing protein [Microbacterium oxydans]|jgi:hypothetical protein|uniref:Membrane protein n=4 Tax=Microbacterium TaxID=33882 RepID=T5K1H5_MICMQ|nr:MULTISPECIES: DUF3566 domain-containing protein [Microbacterium]AZS38714.1 hypothetical protein CVS54_00008 [Microbacterium oxydans]AZS45354.1 hypothetical protein CVS53_00007 [Microbacterium oxydans]EQM73068.1 membrane protein [Microbacterium maritypicum MF109]EYT60670.1 membrane protein [Microbacterium sp. UCD-TDU]KAB1881529.1 DUF3566 domain-containing protein [Microbacterium liquefaciens]